MINKSSLLVPLRELNWSTTPLFITSINQRFCIRQGGSLFLITKFHWQEYEILDYFWYSLPDEDFDNKWEVIGWPHKITQQIDATNEYLNEETDKFQKIQFNDEISLTEKIEQMTVQVTKMSAYTDFSQVIY